MTLKKALKMNSIEMTLDGINVGGAKLAPIAIRRSGNIQWKVMAGEEQTVIRIQEGENPPVVQSILCGKNLIWTCPLKYLIHIIGRWDWEPACY